MTTRPLRYCRGRPNCQNKVTHGLCRDCRPAQRAIERRYQTGVPGLNYGRRWQREAKQYLAAHPFCVDCVATGQALGLAEEVDHIRPHRNNPALFWDRTNWAPRCKAHHSAKTAREVLNRG